MLAYALNRTGTNAKGKTITEIVTRHLGGKPYASLELAKVAADNMNMSSDVYTYRAVRLVIEDK